MTFELESRSTGNASVQPAAKQYNGWVLYFTHCMRHEPFHAMESKAQRRKRVWGESLQAWRESDQLRAEWRAKAVLENQRQQSLVTAQHHQDDSDASGLAISLLSGPEQGWYDRLMLLLVSFSFLSFSCCFFFQMIHCTCSCCIILFMIICSLIL